MSHHSLAVSSNEPNQAGVISAPTVYNEIRIGGAALSDNYSNSPASSLNDATLYFYDPSPVNDISGASITSSSNWISSITIPSGVYILEAAFSVVFTATGQFSFQWYDGSTSRGTRAQLGGTLSHATESASPLASLCIEIDTATTFSVKSTSGSTNLDSIANHGTTPSEQSYIRVRKLL